MIFAVTATIQSAETELTPISIFFRASWEQNTFHGLIVGVGGDGGSIAVLDRVYFVRQIRTVLKFAQLTSDPRFAAFLIEKAEHLRSQIGETSTRDVGSLAPNVEPDKRGCS